MPPNLPLLEIKIHGSLTAFLSVGTQHTDLKGLYHGILGNSVHFG